MDADPPKRSFTIRDLPSGERPRERAQHAGIEALSAPELLALILGRGVSGESVMVTAQRLLSRFESIRGISLATMDDLCGVRGIGLAKACQIKAAFELASRCRQGSTDGKTVVKTPEDVMAVVGSRLRDKKREYFLELLLDTRNHLIRAAEISMGSLDASIVHPREVFKEAIGASSACVVFVHNHPSGDTEASQDDIKLTRNLVEAGKILGIEVLDHIIVGGERFLSMKRAGLF